MPLNTKRIKERVARMNNAWKHGASNITFKGIKQSDFQASLDAAASIEAENRHARITTQDEEEREGCGLPGVER